MIFPYRSMLPARVGVEVCLLAASLSSASEPMLVTPSPLDRQTARRFADVLVEQHLSRQPLDDTVSARAWTNYIAALDPDNTMFVASDIERLHQYATELDDELKNGNLAFAYETVQVWRGRLKDRIAFARGVLRSGFDLAQDEAYSVPQGRQWAGSREVWDLLWRRKVKNELLCHLVKEESPRGTNALVRASNLTLSAYEGRLSIPPGRPDPRWVLGTFLNAVAHAYDPDSAYIPPGEVAGATGLSGEKTTWAIRAVETEGQEECPLGIVRPSAFYRRAGSSASRDIRRVLAHMRRKHVTGVLLDLRGNAGGCQPETVAVTGLFVAEGPIVLTRKAGQRVETHTDTDGLTAYAGPLVVLVDRMTASAAEVLSGTLQDYGRAVVVGDSRTYGKGRCQTFHPLDDTLNLGTACVTAMANYTVSGRSCQGHGIASDIVLPSIYDACFAAGRAPASFESPVDAAVFTPVGDLSSLIPRLREASERRRAGDIRYKPRSDGLAAVARAVRTGEVPLHLEKRLELMHTCGELGDMHKLFSADASPLSALPEPTSDLVLEEALAILRDMAVMTDRPN